MQTQKVIAIIGGGAAGYFAALAAAEESSSNRVIIFEAGAKTLSKVAISGGGRCNVTHNCPDVDHLLSHYPRGYRELKGPFSKFNTVDTVKWFEARGVSLKTERDGRMFPNSDSSQTIIDCLESQAKAAGIELKRKVKVKAIEHSDSGFNLVSSEDTKKPLFADSVLIATGGGRSGFELAKTLGHSVEPPVPSLFTFNIKDSHLNALAGVSVPSAKLRLVCQDGSKYSSEGPLLVTHWGLSGPAVLKLSSWAARSLASSKYKAKLSVNWLGQKEEWYLNELTSLKKNNSRKAPINTPLAGISKRLWHYTLENLDLSSPRNWSEVGNRKCREIAQKLSAGAYAVDGKGVFKEEFVTCGGVSLTEVDFRSMESKLVPGLYFAGEVLNIDALTGGFNFQSAWTTGYIAGCAMGRR